MGKSGMAKLQNMQCFQRNKFDPNHSNAAVCVISQIFTIFYGKYGTTQMVNFTATGPTELVVLLFPISPLDLQSHKNTSSFPHTGCSSPSITTDIYKLILDIYILYNHFLARTTYKENSFFFPPILVPNLSFLPFPLNPCQSLPLSPASFCPKR